MSPGRFFNWDPPDPPAPEDYESPIPAIIEEALVQMSHRENSFFIRRTPYRHTRRDVIRWCLKRTFMAGYDAAGRG